MMKVICRRGGRNVFLGTIENGIFTKTNVSGKVHMYRDVPSWGLDKEMFLAVIAPEARAIRIYDTDTDIGYKITTKKFQDKATEREFGNHGAQLFCPTIYFHKYHKCGKIETPLDEETPIEEDSQLSLL